MQDTFKVVFLTNMVPPYRIPVLKKLSRLLKEFYILVSVEKEENRSWEVDYSNLKIVKQSSITIRKKQKISNNLTDISYIHIPFDTIYQLFKLRPDVIITAEFGFRSIFSILYKKIFFKNICVLLYADLAESTEHHRGKIKIFLRRWLIQNSTFLITNGMSGERYLLKVGADKSRIIKIPYATDEKFLYKKSSSHYAGKVCKMLYVGSLINRKGLIPFLHSLIKWAITHQDQMIEWTLVGNGELREKLMSTKLPKNLTLNLIGHVSYDKLHIIYRKADLFVLPTFEDTWGLVINEAMASSLPVLGSIYAQAVEEMVENSKNGWTFRPDNSDEMYQAINRSMIDFQKGHLVKMGGYAYQKAVKFSTNFVTELMYTAITSCTENQ